MDFATLWSAQNNDTKVAFICAANEKRPGGDWETGVVGYEERLCRRSNLSSHLATPKETNYPIPSEGGLYSDPVGESKLLLHCSITEVSEILETPMPCHQATMD